MHGFPVRPINYYGDKMAKAKPKKEDSQLVHELIPLHEKCSEEEKKELLEKYKIIPQELPKILLSDPAIRHLDVKPGDIIKITRNDPKAGKITYFRVVIND